ncbi:MAG: DUF3108 domain-containing protein [Thiotrichales bacterium]
MKKYLYGLLFCSLVSMNAGGVNAATPFVNFDAVYEVSAAGLQVGEAHIQLRVDGDTFVYSKQTSSRGIASLLRNENVSEVSRGTLSGNRVRIQSYNYTQKRGSERREDNIEFMGDGSVRGNYKGKPYELSVRDDVIDRAAVELLLVRDARPELNNALAYSIVERGTLKDIQFRHEGSETVKVPAGEFACERYSTVREAAKRSTSFCLSPSLGNKLVHAVHDEKGMRIEMGLKSLE